MFGDGECGAQDRPVASSRAGEFLGEIVAAVACRNPGFFGSSDLAFEGCGGVAGLLVAVFGVGQGLFEIQGPLLVFLVTVDHRLEPFDRGLSERFQPVRDLTPRLRPWWLRLSGLGLAVLGGEVAALGGGGDVGAVDVDDRVENIAGVGHVVGVGDDADDVVSTAAGHRDVQVPTCRRCRGEFDRGGDGVGLGAHLGRCVAETDMFMGVVGGEGDLAVPGDRCEGEVAVVVGVGDGQQVTVPDPLTIRGGLLTAVLVEARGDDVADVGGLATSNRHRVDVVDVTGVAGGRFGHDR